MTLEDSIWQRIEGGYKILYDASIPLKMLENATNKDDAEKILDELWDELHHQGDVGIASYLALPQIVRIAKEKKIFDWKFLGICMVIEQQRNLGNNPPLPQQFATYYQQGLNDLNQYVIDNLSTELDDNTYTLAIATMATCKGRSKLGKAISEFNNNDALNGFLEQF